MFNKIKQKVMSFFKRDVERQLRSRVSFISYFAGGSFFPNPAQKVRFGNKTPHKATGIAKARRVAKRRKFIEA